MLSRARVIDVRSALSDVFISAREAHVAKRSPFLIVVATVFAIFASTASRL